jgi:hypothetical protein
MYCCDNHRFLQVIDGRRVLRLVQAGSALLLDAQPLLRYILSICKRWCLGNTCCISGSAVGNCCCGESSEELQQGAMMMLHHGAGPEATPAEIDLASLPNTATTPPQMGLMSPDEDVKEEEDDHHKTLVVENVITGTKDPSQKPKGEQQG